MSTSRILYACTGFGIFILILFTFFLEKQHEVTPFLHKNMDNYGAVSTYWSKQFDQKTPTEVFRLFTSTYKDERPETLHSLGHIFGELLYESHNTVSLPLCYDAVSLPIQSGCLHEFIGSYVSENGTSSIQKLADNCTELDDIRLENICEHGIGHGVTNLMGYDPDDLKGSIEICNSLNRTRLQTRCLGGAFMEYYWRTMLASDGIPPRKHDMTNSFGVCTSIPASAQWPCYFWLPLWWSVADTVPNDEKYTAYQNLCSSVEDPFFKKGCFQGIGEAVVMETIPAYEETKRLCDLASESEEENVYCRSQAAQAYSTREKSKIFADKICEGLSESGVAYCLLYSKHYYTDSNEGPLFELFIPSPEMLQVIETPSPNE